MLEQFQQSQLPQRSLREYLVFEGLVDFLNRHQLLSLGLALFVLGGHYDAVCSLSDHVDDLVAVGDLELLL